MRVAIALVAVATLGAAALVTALYAVPLPTRLAAGPSVVVEYRDGTPAHVFLSPDGKWRVPVQPEEVDAKYLRALVALEDKRFWSHRGVDPLAVLRAAWTDLKAQRRVSGASTLTLQLARVLEPRPRTLRSKLVEAFRAVQLELRLGKRGVLAAYLAYAPYGGNVEGVEAASLAFFGHRATALTPAELATLLAVPQSPAKNAPSPAHAARLRAARERVAQRLVTLGAWPASRSAELVEGPVPVRLHPFPREALHAAAWLRTRSPDVARLRTTLDRGAQALAERVMAGARAGLAANGIHNGAAVVADHESAEVRALVGNFDFWDDAHGGQIAGFAAPRPTGSVLKPFLYALALDRGAALPDFLVEDVPVTYGGWTPRNYDETNAGLVRLEDALSQSLNVPFVGLLKKVGVERFLALLRGMGASEIEAEPGRYGLVAAVGGLELSPLTVAGFYAALAEDGRYRPLRVLPDSTARVATVAFTPGAAFLTRRALSRKDRPDFPDRARSGRAPIAIHWKTGTSFGHRDAWAAGSGPGYTAVVWTGNFDDSPSVHLVGAEAAGPVLFDLLEGVEERAPRIPPSPPHDLAEVEVCAYSGRLATDACPERRRVLAPRASVPTETCPFHVALDVDVATGLALTPACRAGHTFETRRFLAWPATLRRWLRDQQRALPEPPSLAPGCETGVRAPPTIASPAEGEVLMLIPGVSRERQQVPLEAGASAAGARLSWFVDGDYLGSARPEERLWWPPSPGAHDVVVVDEAGATARRRVVVRNGQ